MAEQFKAQHPGTTFDIAAEGSTTGIAAIIDGTAEIGMSSRRAKSSEVGAAAAKGKTMKPTVVAYTTTSLAKLYSETIEGIDPGPVDAIRTTGATGLQVLRFGVLPQVLPLFLSYVLYRFESNVRAATVLGFVGAGGIGLYLQTYLRMIDYPAASTVLLVTVVMVMVVDFASARIRARLI